MSEFAVKVQNPIKVPIINRDEKFPVNVVYCVGRNYVEHVKELGNDTNHPPIFFSKPAWTVCLSGSKITYPPSTIDLQHEVELVIALGNNRTIYGIAVGVDLTKRDVQKKSKQTGAPWFSSKVFSGASPISSIFCIENNYDFSKLYLTLKVNDLIRQEAYCSKMIWNPTEIVKELSKEVDLKPGDLIFTGTPAGVGKIKRGDKVDAEITGITRIEFEII